MRSLALLLAVTAAPAFAAPAPEDVVETPINVPSAVPEGFLLAWKPTVLSVRIDNGSGAQFGSDKFQPLRALGRYTSTLFGGKLLARAELEGGQFETDPQGAKLGTNGFDLTARALGGSATRINQDLTVTFSAGLLTRYQWGNAAGGAPRIGLLGATANGEFEFRIAPIITLLAFIEGGLAPIPYGSEPKLGLLSDASEFRFRLQFGIDLGTRTALDIGYDFTRWHASFARTTVLGNATPDQALLLQAREHAITIGVRWKP